MLASQIFCQKNRQKKIFCTKKMHLSAEMYYIKKVSILPDAFGGGEIQSLFFTKIYIQNSSADFHDKYCNICIRMGLIHEFFVNLF